jgi:hypothetical protein
MPFRAQHFPRAPDELGGAGGSSVRMRKRAPESVFRAIPARTERDDTTLTGASRRERHIGTSGVLAEVPMWHPPAYFVQPVLRP